MDGLGVDLIGTGSVHSAASSLPHKRFARTRASAIAGGTAAIAGVLVGMTFTFYPHTGPDYLIIAFGVVIVGGLGSLIGTFMGGLILGLAQILGAHFLGPGFQLLALAPPLSRARALALAAFASPAP